MGGQVLGSVLGAAVIGSMMKKSAKSPAPPAMGSAPAPAVKASQVTPELELNDTETMAETQAKKRKGKRKYRVDKIKSSEAAGLQGFSADSMAKLKIK